ncbi:hypothetical protein AVEN_231529-1, partial [Araneus ventricosus]
DPCQTKQMIFASENDESVEKSVNIRLCLSTLAKEWRNDVAPIKLKISFVKAGYVDEISVENQEKAKHEK